MGEPHFISDPKKILKRMIWGGVLFIALTIFLILIGEKKTILVCFISIAVLSEIFGGIYYRQVKRGELLSAKKRVSLSFGIIFLLIGICLLVIGLVLFIFSIISEEITFNFNDIMTIFLGILFIILSISYLKKIKN